MVDAPAVRRDVVGVGGPGEVVLAVGLGRDWTARARKEDARRQARIWRRTYSTMRVRVAGRQRRADRPVRVPAGGLVDVTRVGHVELRQVRVRVVDAFVVDEDLDPGTRVARGPCLGRADCSEVPLGLVIRVRHGVVARRTRRYVIIDVTGHCGVSLVPKVAFRWNVVGSGTDQIRSAPSAAIAARGTGHRRRAVVAGGVVVPVLVLVAFALLG
mmetsp:Transcript_6456/g.19403  ORF Transcript_6456/g.19403 Transcript_6456/m.19403 type:complete len:214 (-) Transcript_6456:8-649(-)